MFRRKLFLVLSLFFLISGIYASEKPITMRQALRNKLLRYGPSSARSFKSAFRRAGLSYPPKRLALLIFKKDRRMQLYARNNASWHYIKAFHILAASGRVGPKLHVGDRQVPEGIYNIVGLNPKSHFDLSMHLDYPNAFDRQQAGRDHRQHLGSNIFIHGKNRSIGCIAIGDAGIEKLFPLIATVGISHVKVIIAPDDMRRELPVYSEAHPKWLPRLYHRITLALLSFPEPRHS